MEETVRDPVREGSALVYFRGNCDLYSAPEFKASILKRIESGVGRILIDMSGSTISTAPAWARSSRSSKPRGEWAARSDSRA